MKIKKITLIQLDAPLPDYFTQSHPMPCYGFILIGTILRNAGYDVKIYIENIKAPDWRRITESDAICFFGFAPAMKKILKLVKRIKQERDIPLIVGGSAMHYFPEIVLKYFDFVVHGEGDRVIVKLLQALKENREPWDVKGLYYKKTTVRFLRVRVNH